MCSILISRIAFNISESVATEVHFFHSPHKCSSAEFGIKQDVTAVEQVQRHFVKRLQGLRDLPYTERLRDCLTYNHFRFEDCTLT